ncbi:hypothetical protein L6259_01140 [Candidatus Parcubacteria bacterium]|nr:hypothetical protein [Candidatus Parcubacteria bacterium]
MKKEPNVNLSEVKTFFDPNPGLPYHGAAAPMPKTVKKVADELNGKTMCIVDALAKIKAVLNGEGYLVAEEDCILLWSEKVEHIANLKRPLHCWRVIRFQ